MDPANTNQPNKALRQGHYRVFRLTHCHAIKEETIAINHDLHPGMQTVTLYPCYIQLI